MSKQKLQIEYDYDFCLIGIVSPEKDYRLCWVLNSVLNLKLAKAEDYNTGQSSHSMYSYVWEERFREYHLLANKGNPHTLIEEYKHIDYFLVIKGDMEEEEKKHLNEQIKKSGMVVAAYLIDVHLLKSKQNLIF